MQMSYPTLYSRLTNNDLLEMINVWTELFNNYPYELVDNSLKEYIMTDSSGFAPSPGQLNKLIAERLKKMDPNRNNDPETEWERIEDLLRKGLKGKVKETFQQLPELTQQAIGNSKRLEELSRTDERRLGAVKKEFINRYSGLLKEYERQYLEPAFIPVLLEKADKKLLNKGD